MGILDDAIREHLELKRRRGADPQELEQQEHEALGPIRRVGHEGIESPQAEHVDGEAAFGDEQAAEAWSGRPDGVAEAWSDQPEDSWSLADEEAPAADHAAAPRGSDELEEWDAVEPGPIPGGIGVEPDAAAPATPAPAAPSEPSPARPIDESDYLEQETVEHDVNAEAPERAEEDDMLEETPEFLQDTPDHDRLWFEQRPPRDFDLDG